MYSNQNYPYTDLRLKIQRCVIFLIKKLLILTEFEHYNAISIEKSDKNHILVRKNQLIYYSIKS